MQQTRRWFFRLFPASLVAIAAGWGLRGWVPARALTWIKGRRVEVPTEKVGCVTAWDLGSANSRIHVFLDGREVTERCRVADDIHGFVTLSQRWMHGYRVGAMDPFDVHALELVEGHVEIRFDPERRLT